MEKNYVIYSYVFENHVYVGLSKNLTARHKSRKNDASDTVNKFCKQHSLEIPEPEILETSLTAVESQAKELNWIQYYISLGKEILNKNPCGVFVSSLGGGSDVHNEPPTLPKPKLTKTKIRQIETTYEKCYEIALKYEYKSDFQKDYGYEYRYSKKMGWLNTFDWLKNKMSNKNQLPLTYENYLQVVNNYKTKSEFSKGDKAFYLLGLKEGWNNLMFSKQVHISVPKVYSDITLENVIDELRNYKTRTELNKKNHGLYECCRQNNWLDIVYPRNQLKSEKQKQTTVKKIKNTISSNLVTSEKYPSYGIDITRQCVYHMLKHTTHQLIPRTNQMGLIMYCINVNGKYVDILYHNLVGEFLNKEYDVVTYANNNFNDTSLENLKFTKINMEDVKPFPQYPKMFIHKNGFIYDSNLKALYYGTHKTADGWMYKGTNLSKLCFSLFKCDIRNVSGKMQYLNGNVDDYSQDNLKFIYTNVNDILQMKKHDESTEFIITLNNGNKITLCHLSDKLTCSKLYSDLTERIKNNHYIEQWIYNFIENILPLYIDENKNRNSLKKRTESNGCYWWAPRKKWKSKIFVNDKEYTLGYFDNFETGKYLYELAVLSVKYSKFGEWYSYIERHREMVIQMFE